MHAGKNELSVDWYECDDRVRSNVFLITSKMKNSLIYISRKFDKLRVSILSKFFRSDRFIFYIRKL